MLAVVGRERPGVGKVRLAAGAAGRKARHTCRATHPVQRLYPGAERAGGALRKLRSGEHWLGTLPAGRHARLHALRRKHPRQQDVQRLRGRDLQVLPAVPAPARQLLNLPAVPQAATATTAAASSPAGSAGRAAVYPLRSCDPCRQPRGRRDHAGLNDARLEGLPLRAILRLGRCLQGGHGNLHRLGEQRRRSRRPAAEDAHPAHPGPAGGRDQGFVPGPRRPDEQVRGGVAAEQADCRGDDRR